MTTDSNNPVVTDVANGTISEEQVMHRAAGFYVGYARMNDGMWEPFGRVSDYMPTREQAQNWLDKENANRGL